MLFANIFNTRLKTVREECQFYFSFSQSQIKLQNTCKNSKSNMKTPTIYYLQLFALHANNYLLVEFNFVGFSVYYFYLLPSIMVNKASCVSLTSLIRVPMHPGKSWIFSLKFQDLESPGKNILENYALRHFCSEFCHLKLHQISNFPGLCPGRHWGSLQCSPISPSWWGGASLPLPKNPTPALGSRASFLYI